MSVPEMASLQACSGLLTHLASNTTRCLSIALDYPVGDMAHAGEACTTEIVLMSTVPTAKSILGC